MAMEIPCAATKIRCSQISKYINKFLKMLVQGLHTVGLSKSWVLYVSYAVTIRVASNSSCVCSVVSDSATPWSVTHQAPLSMGFSRQEYRSGLPCPPPGNLPNPGIETASPALAGGFFTTAPPAPPGEPRESSKHQ